ncbi:hypothetical protein F183_A38140 [Bryobacterales bacterium F-183]|nr:hypothetical protein F183_A38140 [Bryobacterales bacterium F-183]
MTRCLLLCVLVILVNWRLVFTGEYSWLEAQGIFERVLPLMQFQAGELHRWRLPIFDPYSPGGQPLIGFGSGVTQLWYLPHTLLLALPLNQGWLFQKPLHWYFALTQCAMAIAMWMFARRRLYLSEGAAFVAALGYALAVPFAAGPDPQALHAAVWLPATFAARPGWKRAFALGLMWLPGHLWIPLGATIALVAAEGVRQSRRDVALGLAIGSITILPGIAFATWPLPYTPPAAGVVLPALGIFGWYIALPRPQIRKVLLPLAVAGILHPALLLCSLAGAAGVALDDSGTIRPMARRWAVLLWIVASAVVVWALLPWIRFDQLTALEPLALPCLLAAAAALLLWSRPEPRRAMVFGALLVLADGTRPPSAGFRMQSRHDGSRPRKLESFAAALPQVAYMKQFQHDRPRLWVDPAVIPYAFGPWWGVETSEPQFATHRLSVRPAPGFERVLYSGDDGVKVFASTKLPDTSCVATETAEFLTPNVRRFAITSSCPAKFDARLSSAKGWRILLDGKSVEYPQQGLPVPAGDHKIEMRFLPIPLIAGALVNLLAALYTFRLARRQALKL